MLFDSRLILTFLELTVFFGLLGWAADMWLRSRSVYLYPAYGIVAFGATAVPITYVIGRFNIAVIGVVCLGILAAGVLGWRRFGWRREATPNGWRRRWPAIILGMTLVALGLIQSSKYGIPGGIDSAIHSSMINGILIHQATLQGSYPLGLHMVILFAERLFHASQALVFLSFYLLLFLSTIAVLVHIADRFVRRPLAGYAVVAAAAVDVSMYNNLINGSGTHLIGIFLSVMLILAAMSPGKQASHWRWVSDAAVMTALWYFHYPSLFFGFLGYWAVRMALPSGRSWQPLIAFGAAAAASLPLQRFLIRDATYIHAIIPGVITLAAAEVLLILCLPLAQSVLKKRWFLLIVGAAAAWLFYHYSAAFLFIPSWYGKVLIEMALIGLVATIMNPRPFSVMAFYAFSGMAILHALLNLSAITSQTKVIVELVYYYGFTYSLILLGAAGILQLFRILRPSLFRSAVIGLAVVYVGLVLASRAFDYPFIQGIQKDDRPISRYGGSNGFTIFYTRHDVQLADWIKNNIHDQGRIMNPGGLYNSWVPLAEHPVVWATYNVPTIASGLMVAQVTTQLLAGQPAVDVAYLRAQGVKYLLLPEQYHVAVYYPELRLRRIVGQSRFYEILPSQPGAPWIRIPMERSTADSDVLLAGAFAVGCRYCYNTFYFTDQASLYELQIDGQAEMTFALKASTQSRRLALLIDRNPSALKYRIDDRPWQTSSAEALISDVSVPAGHQLVVTIKNPTFKPLRIYAAAFRPAE